jgi:hypothetical protein
MNEFDISDPPFTGHCSLIAYPDMKETVMKVKVTTREFIRLLQAAKEFDQQFPWLGQVVWLLLLPSGIIEIPRPLARGIIAAARLVQKAVK